jgi:hypothetical protein
MSEKIPRLLSLGDEESIDVSLLQEFFDLAPPPFIIEKCMLWIDIDIYRPIGRYFF